MDLTFRSLGPWGPGKGANLLPSEVDNNFWQLAQAIVDLTASPALPVGIASITVAGTQMTIHLTDGTALGPYTLPVLTFRWRHEWTPTTSYAELDVFTVTGTGIFMVLKAHTSGATFDPNLTVSGQPAYQQLFGFDVTATLSTLDDVQLTGLANGDMLHWVAAAAKWQNTAGGGSGVLSPIGSAQLLANLTASSAAPIGNTLTGLLDYVISTARGYLLYRGASGWIGLAPGTAGQILSTGGTTGDPSWIASGAGVAIASGQLLANLTASSALPSGNTLSAILDYVLPSVARGTLLYRGATSWTSLAAGTAGQLLSTGGTTGDPSWVVAGGLAAIGNLRLLANISGASAAPIANTLTGVIDAMIGGVDGDILIRAAGSWTHQRPKYIIACSSGNAVLVNSQALLYHRFAKAVTIPANFGAYLGCASQAGGTANATASTVINVAQAPTATPNTFANVGTITIAAGSVTPTFATSGGTSVSFAQGDVLRILGPATADATFAGFYATIAGYET